MLILNGSGTYIRFMNGKMGRKISEGNATMYPDIKSLIGIRILVTKQMFATITQVRLSLSIT